MEKFYNINIKHYITFISVAFLNKKKLLIIGN